VIAAAYMLRLFQGIMQGPKLADLPEREDMSPLEIAALAPIVVAIVLLGIDPGPVTATAARVLQARVVMGSPATARYATTGGQTYETSTP
jgi:NADH-quinone oxidoreductase subunit M